MDNFNIFTIPSALKHANNVSDNLNVNSICSCETVPDHSHLMNWNNSHCRVLMMVTTFTSEILVWVTHFPQNTLLPVSGFSSSTFKRDLKKLFSETTACFFCWHLLHYWNATDDSSTTRSTVVHSASKNGWKGKKNVYNSTIPFRSAGTLILRLVNRKSKKTIFKKTLACKINTYWPIFIFLWLVLYIFQ